MEWEISWKSEKNHSPWHFDRQKETTKQRIPSTRWNAIIVSSLTVWNVFSESRLYFLLLLSLTINKQVLLKLRDLQVFYYKIACFSLFVNVNILWSVQLSFSLRTVSDWKSQLVTFMVVHNDSL